MKEAFIHLPCMLTTSKVMLRRYQEGEGATLYQFIKLNRNRLIDHFPRTVSQITDGNKGELFVRSKIADWHNQKGYFFGIWDLATEQYIGQISIKNIDWDFPRAELAYFISKDFEGKGVMAETLKAIIQFSFEKLRMKKLFIRTTPSNARSSKLAEACGFIKEGLIRMDYIKADGTLGDVLYYGLTIKDY